MKRVVIILAALVVSSATQAQPPSGPYISTTPAYGKHLMPGPGPAPVPGYRSPISQPPAGGTLGPKETIQQGVKKLQAFLDSQTYCFFFIEKYLRILILST
ncbi:MAG: hypothetical protein EP297_04175 [Gammaproteobacteria bacterium]|nr:MAG: hypothetical protein EP297_04175 [Gammaproteobacteria bacterium]